MLRPLRLGLSARVYPAEGQRWRHPEADRHVAARRCAGSGSADPPGQGHPAGRSGLPPTKLQTFFFGIRITRVRIDPKHAIDVIPGHFHALAQCSDAVPFARPISRLQPVVEFGGNVLQPANKPLQFSLQGGLLLQRLALFLEAGEALTEAWHPGCKLPLIDQALGITVDQAGDALTPLANLAFDRGQRRAFGRGLRLQAAPIFFGEPLGGGSKGQNACHPARSNRAVCTGVC
jgi:hypothetical protein